MNKLENIQKIEDIKYRLKRGELDYDQAKEEAQPIIDAMNERAREISKSFGRRHKDFTFIGLMR